MAPKADDGMKIQIIIIGWACMTVCLFSYTAAFSHGASLAACNDMRPKHIRAQPQNPKKKYVTIYTNRSFYLPGDRVPVTVRSTRDFMGFLLQARTVSNDQIAGTFAFIPPSSKQLSCFKDGDAVTHSDKSLKRNLSFVWRAPDKPIGDIKFCLSVVQSYFVYWARIESAIVFDQTTNTTFSPLEDKTSVIMPTPLQIAFTVKGNISSNKVSDATNITLTEDTASPSDNKTGTMPGGILQPVVSDVVDGGQGIHLQNSGRNLSGVFEELVTASVRAVVTHKESPIQSDRILEPSLQDQGLENPLQSFMFRDEASSPNTPHRTESLLSFSTTLLCSACIKDVPAFSQSVEFAVTRSETHAALTPSSLLRDTHLVPPTGKSLPLSHKHNVEFILSTQSSPPSVEGSEKQPVTKKVSANFLHQSEQADSGEVDGEEAGPTPPWMTRPVREAAVPGKGGENPSRGMHLAAAQLGILLGCSAALGMALAAGLRCIHAQYCHKRTDVSFSEPDNNVITVRESGEMMEFRKIRENSFVLVQAEYNWITPSSNGKKQ